MTSRSIDIGSTLNGLDAVNLNDKYSTVLFIGQNPSAKETGKNTTFDRLKLWIDYMGIEEYAFMNASKKTGKVYQSDVDLDNLALAVYKVKKVVALGNFASEALHRLSVPHFKLPHPSPLNRQINDPDFINKTLAECIRYLSE